MAGHHTYHVNMRDYMDRRVTPAKQVTSPTWGPPSPCKQALRLLLSIPLSGIPYNWLIETIYFNGYNNLLASIFYCSLVFSLICTDREIFNSIHYTAIQGSMYIIITIYKVLEEG